MSAAGAACRVCGTGGAAPFAEKDGYRFARCAGCGFVFLDPMPDAAELAGLYAGEGDAIGEYPKARSRFRRARVRAVRMFRHLWGRDALDIGCGGGFMVEAMRRVGARAAGLDIDPRAIAYASRSFPECRFFCEDVAAFERRGLAFDFVHASEVIEHVPDVNAFMAAVSRITRRGGLLYVTTPDIGHRRVPGDVASWDVFTPPRHVQFFNAASLGMLFGRHGFEARRTFFKLKPGLQMLAQKMERV